MAALAARALALHEASGEAPLLGTDAADFEVRLAEEGGEADLAFPALDPGRDVHSFGVTEVALVALQRHDAKKIRAIRSKSLAVIRKKSLRKSMFGFASNGAAAAPEPGKVLLKVRLPCRPATDAGVVVVQARGGWTLQDLKAFLERHFRIGYTEWQFAPQGSQEFLVMDMNVAEVAGEALEIVQGAALGLSSFDIYYSQFTELTASNYVEYDIVKVNRHGTKQRRILGVDRDKIYNLQPKNGKKVRQMSITAATLLDPQDVETKRRFHRIADVKRVAVVRGAPRAAYIVFQGGLGEGEPAYTYEFEDAEVCVECVARIQFLVALSAG